MSEQNLLPARAETQLVLRRLVHLPDLLPAGETQLVLGSPVHLPDLLPAGAGTQLVLRSLVHLQ